MAVATNRPSCGGAAFARERHLALGEFSQKKFGSLDERDVAMADFFKSHHVELVVDAGYDRVHSNSFVAAFPGRIINVHPSLLPNFAGAMDAVDRAIQTGAKVTGATVHVVTDDLDAGPILVQESVAVLEGDTLASLHQRIHIAEHRILPEAIRLMEARLAQSPAVG